MYGDLSCEWGSGKIRIWSSRSNSPNLFSGSVAVMSKPPKVKTKWNFMVKDVVEKKVKSPQMGQKSAEALCCRASIHLSIWKGPQGGFKEGASALWPYIFENRVPGFQKWPKNDLRLGALCTPETGIYCNFGGLQPRFAKQKLWSSFLLAFE